MQAGKGPPEIELPPVGKGDEDEREDVEHDPEGLRQQLESADETNAMRNERDHHDGADDVADPHRYAERQLQRSRHDRRLDRKQHEGEAGIDQRGDGRSDIAEACAARQEIDIDAVADGIAADRQANRQHDEAGDDDGIEGVRRAVGKRDRAADRL